MVDLAPRAGAQLRASAASPRRYYVLAIVASEIAASQEERSHTGPERNHFGNL
jgi:hypothetical protein